VQSFNERLRDFDEIYFYHNPGRFHPLYRRVLAETALRPRIVKITHISDVI